MKYAIVDNPTVKWARRKTTLMSIIYISASVTLGLLRPSKENFFMEIVTNVSILAPMIYNIKYALEKYMSLFGIYKFGNKGEFSICGHYLILICLYIPFINIIRVALEGIFPLELTFVFLLSLMLFYSKHIINVYIEQLEKYYHLESLRY